MLKIVKSSFYKRDFILFNINHIIIVSVVFLVLSILGSSAELCCYLLAGFIVLVSCQVFFYFSDFYERNRVKSTRNRISSRSRRAWTTCSGRSTGVTARPCSPAHPKPVMISAESASGTTTCGAGSVQGGWGRSTRRCRRSGIARWRSRS